MNRLNKLLWGILSFGISLVYRANTTNASIFSGLTTFGNGNVGDTITESCDEIFGTGILNFEIIEATETTTEPTNTTKCRDLPDYCDEITSEYNYDLEDYKTNSYGCEYGDFLNLVNYQHCELCPGVGSTDQSPLFDWYKISLEDIICYSEYTGGTGHVFRKYKIGLVGTDVDPDPESTVLTVVNGRKCTTEYSSCVGSIEWLDVTYTPDKTDCRISVNAGTDGRGHYKQRYCYYEE